MNKLKVTKKAVIEASGKYFPVYSLPYSFINNNLSFIDYMQSPVAFTCGLEGWYCDIYDFKDWCITCGYRPFKHCKKKQQEAFFSMCEKIATEWKEATKNDYTIPKEKIERFYRKFLVNLNMVTLDNK